MQAAIATARQKDSEFKIKCRFCHALFTPEPEYKRQGKIVTRITVCPICGNGVEKRLSAKWFQIHHGGGGQDG